MLRNLEQVGDSRLWAINAAQRSVTNSLGMGVEQCHDFVEFGAAAYFQTVREYAHPTQVRTCAKFISQSIAVMDGWEQTGVQALPVEHVDFGYDLTTSEAMARVLVLLVQGGTPGTRRSPEGAVNNFRAVRLALPEILRKHQPSTEDLAATKWSLLREVLGDAAFLVLRDQPRR